MKEKRRLGARSSHRASGAWTYLGFLYCANRVRSADSSGAPAKAIGVHEAKASGVKTVRKTRTLRRG